MDQSLISETDPAGSLLPAMQFANVSMRFGAGSGMVRALEDVSLDIPVGQFVSIVGRSGCGKSTLLRIVSGLLPATTGTVAVMGKDLVTYQKDKRFGFVFQDASLFPWKTAAQNVSLPLEILGRGDASTRRARAEELLNLVQLGGFADHYPAQLSGGMRQRVSIARALSYEPEILLMDEPFGALDEFTRREMHDLLIGIWKRRPLTVMFVTHSLTEALHLSDRVVVMAPRPGRVRAVVDVAEPRPTNQAARRSTAYLDQLTLLEGLLDEP